MSLPSHAGVVVVVVVVMKKMSVVGTSLAYGMSLMKAARFGLIIDACN